jgi:glycosyltransferase involved in cell wall biosynthesis
MNILLLTQFFSPTRGGGEIMFYQLADQLARRGHKVFVIKHKIMTSNLSKDDLNNLPSKVIVYDVDPAVEHKGGLPAGILQNLLYVFNSIRVGLRIIKSNHVDVIHCNNYSPIFAGWFLSKLTGVPLLVTIHDVASLHGYDFWRRWMRQFGGLSKVKAFIGYVSELLTIKLSGNIHTVSETSKRDILSFKPKCHVYVIPNSLNLEYYKAMSEDEIEYGDFILFIGRLIYYKHLEVVIEALKILRDKCNVKLVVLGDGPMRRDWENLVERYNLKDYVEFKGYVSHEEKLYYLSKCRALVLPSTFEGFGIVILEAWALKKPVIVANVEPLNKIVTHGSDGYVVEKNKSSIWAEYIYLLMKNKELCEQMGSNGFKKLVHEYNVGKHIDVFEKLYTKLLASSSINSKRFKRKL